MTNLMRFAAYLRATPVVHAVSPRGNIVLRVPQDEYRAWSPERASQWLVRGDEASAYQLAAELACDGRAS